VNQAIHPSLPPSLPQVLLVERLYMRREMYLSIMMDRSTQGPVIVASPVGGTSIEDVAASNPEKIFTEAIDIMEGLTEETALGIATKIGRYLPFPPSLPHALIFTQYKSLKTLFFSFFFFFLGLEPGTATHAAGADLVKKLYQMMIATYRCHLGGDQPHSRNSHIFLHIPSNESLKTPFFLLFLFRSRARQCHPCRWCGSRQEAVQNDDRHRRHPR